MNEMTPRERVIGAMTGKAVDRVPWIELTFATNVAMQMAGGPSAVSLEFRTTMERFAGSEVFSAQERFVLESLMDAEVARITGKDNVMYWGAMAPFADGSFYLLNPNEAHLGPSADGIIKTPEDVDAIEFAPLDGIFRDNAIRFLERKADRAAGAMIWMGIDPVLHSMGFEDFSVALMEDPALVERFLEKVTSWSSEAVSILCELGFDFIWGGDDIAYNSAPFFSPATYRDHLLPYTRKVAESISLPWIYHSDGNLVPLLDDLLSQGMLGIHPLEPGSMDLDMLKDRYGASHCLVGNIDLNLLALGTELEVRQQVKERIAQLGRGYRYMVSSSNAVTWYCKPENVRAMADAVLEFGTYPKES